jgi:ParB family chromosome partitioning protein
MERFGLTQEEAAERVGKSRAAVANILRLLKLPEIVLKEVESGTLSYGHARALIPLASAYGAEFTAATAERVIRGGLSVRQTESLVKNLLSGAGSREKRDIVGDQYYGRIEREMSDILGRKATLSRKSGGSGVLKLAYSSPEDLEVLIKKLCGSDFFNNEI